MPNDELTFTDASTLGLQGFQFDTNLGAGTLDGARLPETKGMSGLPDGFVTAAEEGLDMRVLTSRNDGLNLDAMLSEKEGALPITAAERKEAALQNLDWLDPTQEQDPDRLPENPTNIKSELEELWTSHRTDAFSLVPNRDKDIEAYRDSIQEGPRSGLPGQKTATVDLKDAVFKAIRLSHYGTPMIDIKQGLVDTLGHEAIKTRKAVQLIEKDHGLAGNVFVRASAFPGLKNGKWAKELKKIARTARYVITDDEAIAAHLGMTMVDEVPWGEALEHYSPLLKAANYKIASKGDPKEILRQAFTRGPVATEVAPTPKPQGQMLSTPRGPDASTVVVSADEHARNQKMRAAHVWIARKVKEGKITQQDAQDLFNFSKKAGVQDVQVLKMASDLVVASVPTVKEYKGTVQKQIPVKKEITAKADLPVPDTDTQKSLLRWARLRMTEGAVGNKLDSLLNARFSSAALKAVAEPLKAVREAHEGLSGHVYIDADIYASPSGVTGCEKGALKHRAGTLKFVLAMDRCASCASNSGGVCQKYNKKLASKVPVANPKVYQQKVIKMANRPVMENDTNSFNPDEFNLHNGALDGVRVAKSPQRELLSGISFGGIRLE
jgi:hypothetical protein